MRDIHSGIATVQTLDPALTTATRYGAPVDRKGFEAVEHIVCIGATDEELSPELAIACAIEVSENGGDWQPVGEQHEVLGGPLGEDGIFAVAHEDGTPVAALALLAHAHLKPVTP